MVSSVESVKESVFAVSRYVIDKHPSLQKGFDLPEIPAQKGQEAEDASHHENTGLKAVHEVMHLQNALADLHGWKKRLVIIGIACAALALLGAFLLTPPTFMVGAIILVAAVPSSLTSLVLRIIIPYALKTKERKARELIGKLADQQVKKYGQLRSETSRAGGTEEGRNLLEEAWGKLLKDDFLQT